MLVLFYTDPIQWTNLTVLGLGVERGNTEYTLELGFIPQDIKQQFREIEERFSRRASFDASLHFLMWDDWVLSLNPDRSAGTSKTEQLDKLYREKEMLMEPLRRAVEQMVALDGESCTASFGVTAFSSGDDLESIVARVDAGLYQAKAAGRNRVISKA